MPAPRAANRPRDEVRRSGQIKTGSGSDGGSEGTAAAALGLLFGRLFGMLAYLAFRTEGSTGTGSATVKIAMPQCKQCSQTAPITPQYVDFEWCRMRFIVHRDFAEQFLALNPQ